MLRWTTFKENKEKKKPLARFSVYLALRITVFLAVVAFGACYIYFRCKFFHPPFIETLLVEETLDVQKETVQKKGILYITFLITVPHVC